MRFGKRILSVLLTVCMMLTLLPAAVAAEVTGEHKHCICGGDVNISGVHDSHTEVEFTKWESESTLPEDAGYYYLTTDVKFSHNEGWNFNADIVLCLNGHNITNTGGKRAVKVETETFTLCDCAETDGVLCSRNGESDKNTDGSVEVKESGTFHMYGGSLSGNHSTEWKGGGVDNQGTFHMYGGTISNNTMSYGAGVLNRKSNSSDPAPVFYMYGGTISGNTSTGYGTGADKKSPNGAGVMCMNNTNFTMYGGTISGNYALRGGGIYAEGGTVTLKGGSISNNIVSQDGGGIYAISATKLKISGGTISGNTATYGAGIYMQKAVLLTATGGKILNNTANGHGGGLFVHSEAQSASLKNIRIAGNAATGNEGKGGGIYSEDLIELYAGTVVSKNTAPQDGGGIYSKKSIILKEANIVISENTSKYGAGVYVCSGSAVAMLGGSICDNTANALGGGLFIHRNASSVSLKNITVTGNTAIDNGGGVYNEFKNVEVAGSINVTGNKDKTGNANNFFMGTPSSDMTNHSYIKIGNMSADASIGVTVDFSRNHPATFSKGGKNYAAQFTSDSPDYFVGTDGDNLKLEKAITVTFNACGGTVTPAAVGLCEGETLTALPEPTKTGYLFVAWYDAETGGNAVDTDKVYNADTTLYARWEECPHKYDDVFDTVCNDCGYVREMRTFTVTLETYGGLSTSVTTGTDGRVTSLPTPVRDGYIFEGWYDAPAGGTRITEGYVFTANTTLYARWTKDKTLDLGAWYGAVRMLYGQKFTVEATAAPGGTVTPEGISEVLYDRSVTYRITPDEGYRVVSVLVDGEDMGALEKYTFKHVREDHTISVIFEEIE